MNVNIDINVEVEYNYNETAGRCVLCCGFETAFNILCTFIAAALSEQRK